MNLNKQECITMVHLRNVSGIFANFFQWIFIENFKDVIFYESLKWSHLLEFCPWSWQKLWDGDDIGHELGKIGLRGRRKTISRIEEVCQEKE